MNHCESTLSLLFSDRMENTSSFLHSNFELLYGFRVAILNDSNSDLSIRIRFAAVKHRIGVFQRKITNRDTSRRISARGTGAR